ncbi:hypothetical protein SNEBB_004748 [Seison nebaliae]|nr:hypothetical protein SNEBB_004748 [Seison nebaliae]
MDLSSKLSSSSYCSYFRFDSHAAVVGNIVDNLKATNWKGYCRSTAILAGYLLARFSNCVLPVNSRILHRLKFRMDSAIEQPVYRSLNTETLMKRYWLCH